MTETETTIDPGVVKARRLLIRQDAPCEGCGSSYSSCEESRQRRDDPTAPEWFGCCAMGTGMAPCHHRSDPGALAALLQEIENGAIRTAEEILAERAEVKARHERERGPLTGPMHRQGEWWRMKDGTWIRVADMAPSHRGNTARMLLRNARAWATKADLAEWAWTIGAPDDVVHAMRYDSERRASDPQAWVAGTALLRALTDGLTGDDARGLDLAQADPELDGADGGYYGTDQ